MPKKNKLIFFTLLSAILLFAQIEFCSATQNLGDAIENVGKAGESAGYLPDVSPLTIISAVVSAVVSLLGVIFIGLIIYGGFIWMTARGNEERVTKAKDLMTAAVIGLIIVLAAYAISYFVISKMTQNTLKTSLLGENIAFKSVNLSSIN